MAILKYKDPTTNLWIKLPFTAQISTGLPIGIISPYAGNVAPDGWAICDGSAISRVGYPELFNIIGTTYGSGDGINTFNLPNLKGKVVVGLDGSDSDFDNLGETSGEKIHTLNANEIPEFSFATSHVAYGEGACKGIKNVAHTTKSDGVAGSTTYEGAKGSSQTYYEQYDFGKGLAHNNLQPYLVENYIIKTRETTSGVIATVENNLTSSSTENALSANQGKILNDKITNVNTYSTEEINTGKKWIDGKDIYRRVFVGTKTSDNLVIKIADNIDFSYLFSGRLSVYAIPFYESEQVYCRVELDNNYVTIKGGSSSYSQGTITLIIEYTKTN